MPPAASRQSGLAQPLFVKKERSMLHKFKIEEPGLTLTQALKIEGVVDSGGQGKALIADGRVRVNGEVELRKRRQMVIGDVVELETE